MAFTPSTSSLDSPNCAKGISKYTVFSFRGKENKFFVVLARPVFEIYSWQRHPISDLRFRLPPLMMRVFLEYMKTTRLDKALALLSGAILTTSADNIKCQHLLHD